jgi:hypothetical protein
MNTKLYKLNKSLTIDHTKLQTWRVVEVASVEEARDPIVGGGGVGWSRRRRIRALGTVEVAVVEETADPAVAVVEPIADRARRRWEEAAAGCSERGRASGRGRGWWIRDSDDNEQVNTAPKGPVVGDLVRERRRQRVWPKPAPSSLAAPRGADSGTFGPTEQRLISISCGMREKRGLRRERLWFQMILKPGQLYTGEGRNPPRF